MNIQKGGEGVLRRKIGFYLTLLFGCGLFVARLFLYQTQIDPVACVYQGDSLWVYLPLLLLVLGGLIGLIFYYCKEEAEMPIFPGGTQGFSAICCFVLALGVADVALGYFLNSSRFFNLFQSNLLFAIAYSLCVLAAPAGLIGSGIQLLMPKRGKISAVFPLLPLPFFLVRLLQYYLGSFSIRAIAEFPWEMGMLAAECIFFLFYARRISGYRDRRTLWMSGFFAGLCLLLTLASGGVRFFLLLRQPELLNAYNQPVVLDLTFALLSLSELASLSFGRSGDPAQFCDQSGPTLQEEEEAGFVLF